MVKWTQIFKEIVTTQQCKALWTKSIKSIPRYTLKWKLVENVLQMVYNAISNGQVRQIMM